MSLFLSSTTNKVDKKGRVSVPSSFRSALGDEVQNGIVVFRSLQVDALDACSLKHLDILSASLEKLSLTPEMYELIETTIFGGSVQLQIDADGRIVLPEHFMQAVGIEDEAAFVGRRRTFQIWNPKKFNAYEDKARDAVRAHNISLSKIIADASALNGGDK
ncbi:MAG: division/cell wall cluster transcriptional repressor MraZ [Alphaproteobacteria bacterium]|nr:division/cell wall cluster transcriptional repressor MraZ [Alphaproteobacteria bacterium]